MAKRNYIPPVKSESMPDRTTKPQQEDVGFGSIVSNKKDRYINKDGSFNVVRNTTGFGQLYLYQWLVLISWTKFFVITVVFYFVINCFFASLYLFNGIENMSGVSQDGMTPFWTAFFFSVQTLTTVGYGSISPVGFGANFIAAIGALTGLMTFALGTGLLFARFSKPRADIVFSHHALVSPYLEKEALMFRLANKRRNMLTNLRIEVICTWIATDQEGQSIRKYKHLDVERDHLSMLPLSWTVVHPIDKESPLSKMSARSCQAVDVEIIVILEAYDDTFANIIRRHTSYKFDEIIWQAKFDKMFYFNKAGHSVLELNKVNDYSELS